MAHVVMMKCEGLADAQGVRAGIEYHLPHSSGLRVLVREPIAWLRDVDGTGSLHPCSEGDPGAIAVYALEEV